MHNILIYFYNLYNILLEPWPVTNIMMRILCLKRKYYLINIDTIVKIKIPEIWKKNCFFERYTG